MGGSQCHLSILINGNVSRRYFLNVPVDFKIVQCHLSILRNDNVPCRYFLNVPVDFKIFQCRLSNLRKGRVALSNLRVKGPHSVLESITNPTDDNTTPLHRHPQPHPPPPKHALRFLFKVRLRWFGPDLLKL